MLAVSVAQHIGHDNSTTECDQVNKYSCYNIGLLVGDFQYDTRYSNYLTIIMTTFVSKTNNMMMIHRIKMELC